MGQQFELEGEVYVRTGPLVASHAGNGKQRFMARYVVVKPVSVVEAGTLVQGARMVSSDAVSTTFETFHGRSLAALGQLEADLPAERLNAVYAEIAKARRGFLDTLAGL